MKQKLVVTTPFGTFSRTTFRPYTHIVVAGGFLPEVAQQTLDEYLGRMARTKHPVDELYAGMLRKRAAGNPNVVQRSAFWHGSLQLAQKRARELGKLYKVHGIFPVAPASALSQEQQAYVVAEQHIAADAACGRDWHSPQGCACGACRIVRARQVPEGGRA